MFFAMFKGVYSKIESKFDVKTFVYLRVGSNFIKTHSVSKFDREK